MKRISHAGIVVLGLACTRAQPTMTAPEVEAEGPAILPIEREGSSLAEVSTPEHLLGLRYDDPRVTDFVGEPLDATQPGWDSLARGCGLALQDGVITIVVLFGEAMVGGYEPYAAAMPGGIRASDRAEDVRGRLGPPDRTGLAGDRWFHDTWTMLVSYAENGVVQFILLTPGPKDPARQAE